MSESTVGLSLSRLVSVTTSLTPVAVQLRNFGATLIIGASNVISLTERLREYDTYAAILGDFPVNSPEALAGQAFFAQSPQPSICFIGRWNDVASPAVLYGGQNNSWTDGVATPGMSAGAYLAALKTITAGVLNLTVDGTALTLTAINFSTATTMFNIATILQTAIAHSAVVTWDPNNKRFFITSGTTGGTSAVGFAIAGGTGATDVGGSLGLRAADGAFQDAQAPLETLAAAVSALATASGAWYAATLADTATPAAAAADHVLAAGVIEALSTTRVYGVTSQSATELTPGQTTSVGYALSAGGFTRSTWIYSSKSPYAMASFMGRAATVDFTGENTTITMKFKQLPGITPETLTDTQAAAIESNNGNVYVNYANSIPIVEQGTMANGDFYDERQGLDWLANYTQADLVNTLIGQPKIPQTDDGEHILETTAEADMAQAVRNGLFAPGVWTGPSFGTLKTGDTLTAGYYVYRTPVALQSQADRRARKATALQIAGKLAGAVHSANALITVVR